MGAPLGCGVAATQKRVTVRGPSAGPSKRLASTHWFNGPSCVPVITGGVLSSRTSLRVKGADTPSRASRAKACRV